ncbi:biotin--[acetyl-CoA-carboxylase] ligase [Lysobacter sp. GX 14042]|uniref:biotin--[acetyl-CoA-carboxylase] ligase n=1 Tax=Lysobacter sp. GX 14042 TaxID=2907155 RepID=UPI001F41CC18|nr:biotin--[acetyl-CoA-carboxylase] ligase [Lysobacter sp. GX 14042]MCE7032011.1 biotin--[acetyl-CoA-carboxylase] ligase [Lysobacter sp. GX 14042]
MADPLDSDLILARLGPAVRARMASLDVQPQVDSTNAELLRRPMPEGGLAAVLLADSQQAGRGRRGKDWASPPGGNLYLSLARGFPGGLARLEGLSLVAGIAAAEALHALGYQEVRLKWPNDLVVAGHGGRSGGLRKLGGLLVEGAGAGTGQVRAVLGIGINVRMPPLEEVIDQPWIDLATLSGRAPARSDLAAAVLGHWIEALDVLDRDGFAGFLPRFRALDALGGRAVELHLAGGAVAGHACGLAANGALLVRLEDGTERAFHSGEVSVRQGPVDV